MSARFFLPARLPLCAGLLYLALPLLLFLQGWVHLAFSAPLCAALACGLYVCARHLPAQRLPLSGRRLAALGLLSFFCLMLVLFIFVPALNAGTVGIMVPVSVLFTVGVARILYKKGIL